MRNVLFAAGAALTVLASATAAQAADGTGNASATVQTAITVSESQALAFGTFSVGGSGGTLVVAPDGSASETGDVVSASGNANGAFDVTGDANASVTISLPANDTVTIEDAAANTLAINDFVHDQGASPVLDGSGNMALNVGGTLVVAGNQPSGTYTGTYTVSVNY